jgi:hypothetical protein
MATTAKLTAVSVVCHNTLSVAVRDESDHGSEAVSTVVKVNHPTRFNVREVRMQLGIFVDTFDKWMFQTRLLAAPKIDRATASQASKSV